MRMFMSGRVQCKWVRSPTALAGAIRWEVSDVALVVSRYGVSIRNVTLVMFWLNSSNLCFTERKLSRKEH